MPRAIYAARHMLPRHGVRRCLPRMRASADARLLPCRVYMPRLCAIRERQHAMLRRRDAASRRHREMMLRDADAANISFFFFRHDAITISLKAFRMP